MQANKIPNWTIFDFGLSNYASRLPFYQNLESNMESTFVGELKSHNHILKSLSVETGDSVIEKLAIDRLDLIKIDVEGFEARVILGLENSISHFRPIIFMEWDKQITKDQFKFHDIFNKAVFKNYELKAITRKPKKSLVTKILRMFSKNTKGDNWTISNFNVELNYRHMILIPKEKMFLFEGL
jgi:FkbM family methyltransferase